MTARAHVTHHGGEGLVLDIAGVLLPHFCLADDHMDISQSGGSIEKESNFVGNSCTRGLNILLGCCFGTLLRLQ